jgi:hypothetical protein
VIVVVETYNSESNDVFHKTWQSNHRGAEETEALSFFLIFDMGPLRGVFRPRIT